MKVLVTGSQGFIGTYLCQELLDKGYDVVGMDNYSKYGRVVRPHDTHPNFTFHEADVTNITKRTGNWNFDAHFGIGNQTQSFKDVDYIIAGAAMIGGISYFHKYAYDLLATNERILASTFDLAIELHKHYNLRKILVISSSMVFENTELYPTPETEVVTCPPPSSTYGFQKLASEFFCKGAYEQYGLPYTVIRPFNCVGIGEEEALGEESVYTGNIKMLMSHVLPDLIHKALLLKSTDSLPILGSGDQVRHYTNGKDIARGIVTAMTSENATNEDFNISNAEPTSVKELATIVWQEIHGCDPTFEHCEPFAYDVQMRSPDVGKARDLLGFTTDIELIDSVREVIAWMKGRQHEQKV